VWLGSVGGMAQREASRVPRHASAALEQAARYMMALPVKADTVALAAQGTQEGHWRFVNRVGEMFTVGTPDEMKRVVAVLYPEAKAGARIVLYMTEDTVFRHRATLKALPAGAELNMVVGGEGYRLQRRGEGGGLLAEVRPNVGVEPREGRLFVETLWHLARPLGRARVRVLALEPGGPRALSAWPRADPTGKGVLVDAIDPASLSSAMGSVAGQALLLVARLEGGVLYVRPSSGPEHAVPLGDLLKVAAAADVNLIVLQTVATPRQPSGRNRLWNPEAALRRAQLADLLGGIAGRSRHLAVVATAAAGRTALEVAPGGELAATLPVQPVRDRLSAIVADLSGRAGVTAVQASLLAGERQRELDRRLLPGIPAVVQIGYAALMVLGLLGMPVAWAWWARVWPPEAASEYAGRGGYWAAATVRGLVFLLAFLPMAAIAAAPYNLARQIGDAVRRAGWRWRRAEDGAAEPAGKGRQRRVPRRRKEANA
jgi:hypothetical protein